jgi:tyrosyl-tRNA synthetase
LSTPDADVGKLLRLFTIIPADEIKQHIIDHAADPGKRLAQHLLAAEVLELVHGKEVADRTRNEHRAMRAPTLAALQSGANKTGSLATPSEEPTDGGNKQTAASGDGDGDAAAVQRILLPKCLVLNKSPSEILYAASLAKSKSAAARLVSAGTLYAAMPQASEASSPEPPADLMNTELRFAKQTVNVPSGLDSFTQPGNLLVLRLGKWKIRIIEVVPDAEYEARATDSGQELSSEWLRLKAAQNPE